MKELKQYSIETTYSYAQVMSAYNRIHHLHPEIDAVSLIRKLGPELAVWVIETQAIF